MKRGIHICFFFSFFVFLSISNFLWANCDPNTAELILTPGKVWPVTRQKFTTGTTASSTLQFNAGTTICQGTITQGLDGDSNGILTEAANDNTPNYRIVFTFEAPDPAGRAQRGMLMLIRTGAGTNQTIDVVSRPNGKLVVIHPGNGSITE